MTDEPTFDWSLVRSFLAVVDAGSVLGGARRLGLLQPTVSRHVAELERQLGSALFERTARGVVPTEAATAMLPAARAMARDAQAIAAQLDAARAGTGGRVRISASTPVATWLLPGPLARLREAHPGIAIDLVATNDLSNLLEREADIAVRMARPRQANVVARKLADIPVVAVASERYLRHAGTPRRLQELAQHAVVGFDRDDSLRTGLSRLGLPMGRTDFALRTDDLVAYLRLVAEGAGIGFVTEYSLHHMPGCRRILRDLRIPPLPCWLAVHREVRDRRAIRLAFDFLGEALGAALAPTATAPTRRRP